MVAAELLKIRYLLTIYFNFFILGEDLKSSFPTEAEAHVTRFIVEPQKW